MAHPKCTRSIENLVMEQQTCGKGPKLGLEYLPTYKTLHCGRTAGALCSQPLRVDFHMPLNSLTCVQKKGLSPHLQGAIWGGPTGCTRSWDPGTRHGLGGPYTRKLFRGHRSKHAHTTGKIRKEVLTGPPPPPTPGPPTPQKGVHGYGALRLSKSKKLLGDHFQS